MAKIEKTDLFLTHDWGKDEDERDNHARVGVINEALKSKGYVTWFDEDRMQGNIPQQMASGIENTKIVLTFITKRYETKVTGNVEGDNCKLEFSFAANNKTKGNMIAVVMEKGMKTASRWRGILGMFLGDKLYVDMSGDLDNEQYLHTQLALLCKQIAAIGVIPRRKYQYPFTGI